MDNNICECCKYTPRLGLRNICDYYVCYACAFEIKQYIFRLTNYLSFSNINSSFEGG